MQKMYGPLSIQAYNMTDTVSPGEISLYTDYFTKNAKILEPMCGSGRFLIPLLQAGYDADGADISGLMLSSCKERALKVGLEPNLFQGAIESMSLPYTYDVIIIPYGSFQLLYPKTTAFNTLQNIQKHLKPNGKLILDLFIPWELFYKDAEVSTIENTIKLDNENIIQFTSVITTNKYEQFSIYQNNFRKLSNNNMIADEQEQMTLCWYYRHEMELTLEKYGFKNIIYSQKYFDDYQHMIFVGNTPHSCIYPKP